MKAGLPEQEQTTIVSDQNFLDFHNRILKSRNLKWGWIDSNIFFWKFIGLISEGKIYSKEDQVLE